MKRSLLSKFDKELILEAKRVNKKMLKIHKSKQKVNMSYSQVVKKLVKQEYKGYWCYISLIAPSFIPKKYVMDPSGIYMFVDKEQDSINHLKGYIEFSKQNDKNHYIAAKKIAIEIINFCNKNPNTKESLAEILSKKIEKYFPKHYDSVDIRAVVLLLEQELRDKRKVIKKINPLRIKEL